jgi:hypothetical protein
LIATTPERFGLDPGKKSSNSKITRDYRVDNSSRGLASLS